MPFNSTSLSVMAYANGFTLWHYRSADTLEEVKKKGYFNNTAAFMRAGDRIMITLSKDDEAQNADIFVSKVENNEVFIKEIGVVEVIEQVDADFLEKILQEISAREENKTAEIKAPEAQPQKVAANGQKTTA